MTTDTTLPAEELLAVTFRLGDTAFGLDAAAVGEVVRPGDVTPVRHAPQGVVGIRNLRGRIVTILDGGVCLGLPPVVPHTENRVLMIAADGEPLGLLVDAVLDSIPLRGDEFTPVPPNLAARLGTAVRSLTRHDGRLVALLDPAFAAARGDSAPPPRPREA